MSSLRAIVSIGVFTASALVAAAQTPPARVSLTDRLPFADKLPAETTVYAFRAGGDTLGRKIKGTPAGDIVADEDVAAMLSSLEGMFGESDDAKVKHTWALVVEMFHSDTVCAHIPGERVGHPDVMLLAIPRTDERRKSLKAAVQTFAKSIMHGDDADTADEAGEEVPGGTLYGAGAGSVRLGWVSDRLVMFRGDRARAIALGEASKSPLIQNARFLKAASGMKLEDPVGFYFYNLQPIWREALAEGGGPAPVQPAHGPDAGKDKDDDATSKPATSQPANDPDEESKSGLVISGLTNLTAMAGGVSVHDGRYHNEHFWVLEGPRRGLFKHIANNPIPPEWLKAIPADAVSFTYGTIDPQSLLQATLLERVKRGGGDTEEDDDSDDGQEAKKQTAVPLHKIEQKKETRKEVPSSGDKGGEPIIESFVGGPLAPIDDERQSQTATRPSPTDKETQDKKEQTSKSKSKVADASGWSLFGVEYGKALIEELGTRYLIYRRPSEGLAVNPFGMFFPPLMVLPPHQMVIALEIKDRARFAAAFEDYSARARKELPEKADGGFLGGGPPRMRRIKYQGQWIHEFQYYVGVYFHLTKDRLLISTSPELIKDAIVAASGNGGSLVNAPEFKAVYAKVPKDACCLIYMHKRSFFELLYKGYAGLAQQFGPMALSAMPKNDFSFADLPPAKSISRHMKESAYLYGVATPDGVRWDGQADLLPLSWWVAQIQTIVDGAILAEGAGLIVESSVGITGRRQPFAHPT